MTNVNDLGYGTCPKCKKWKELTRYSPKEKHLKRKEKKKYCASCVETITAEREPFHRIKKAISNHKTANKEGDYTFTDLMQLHKQQGVMCAYCGTGIPYEFSLDHVIPTKFGGRNLLANILLVCPLCNSAKQHFELFYWLRKKNYKLRERIIRKVRESYERHDYECIATCEDCHGSSKPSGYFCKTCNCHPAKQACG